MVWRIEVPMGASTDARLLKILSADERTRADRYLRSDDRDRSVASHAAKRIILAGRLQTAATELAFEPTHHGKPVLGGKWAGRSHFNLSHSGRAVLLAVSQYEIGVDVEALRSVPDWLRVAGAHFSQYEIGLLSALPPSSAQSAFFSCWTRKEAVVKALAAGLSMGLDRFSVTIPPAPAALVEIEGSELAARAWRLHDLAPWPDHIGCVAMRSDDAAVTLATLSGDRLCGATELR